MKNSFLFLVSLMTLLFFQACSDDESTPDLQTIEFEYALHNGQVLSDFPYRGYHPSNFSAMMRLEEMDNGNTMISITLNNTVDGETYNIHAHDAADPATTPNGTPYNETPNGDILIQTANGNGGSVTVSQEAQMSFDELTDMYEGFFVVHDPLQPINTADVTTYIAVGSFARSQPTDTFQSATFSYDFNTGQVSPDFAYAGTHPTNLSSMVEITELADGQSRVAVRIMNSLDGETYPTHSHDMADPATTPNGTPYNETPNGDVFAMPIMGNGGLTGGANISPMSYSELTTTYDAFFVIHDPLQPLTTVDPTTYVNLGVFAR